MYTIDPKKFENVMKERGYGSLGAFAKVLGVHRNTLHHYLSGCGVFPASIEKAIRVLNVLPQDILADAEESDRSKEFEMIAGVVDGLRLKFPEITFVLFGSRARGTGQKYSDWDIGVYSNKGLAHEVYRGVVKLKNELSDDLPYFIDIVNLNRADDDFLNEASKGWIFLAGSPTDWISLQRKAAA